MKKLNWQNDPSTKTPLEILSYESYSALSENEKHGKCFAVIGSPTYHDKLVPLICERCGGSINKETYKCEHCGTQYEWR